MTCIVMVIDNVLK